MRYAVTHKVWYIVPLCFIVGTIVWFLFLVRVFCVPIFCIDKRVALNEQQRVRNIVQSHKNDADPDRLISILHETCAWIKHVAISYHPPHFMHVTIDAHNPVSCFNMYDVILSNRRIVDKELFTSKVRKGLPHVVLRTVQPDSHFIDERYFEHIISLNDDVARSFVINIKSLYKYALHDKQDTHCTLLCLSDHLSTDELITTYQKVKNDVIPTRASKWLFDARFTDQIVVYKDDKEIGYVS